MATPMPWAMSSPIPVPLHPAGVLRAERLSVTGSAIRTSSIKVFFVFRVLRLIPALVTEVTLAALVLGPLLTSLALVSYFSDWHFYDYFGNIIGRIRFVLPGVFEHNPHASIVNINLWTLRPEFFCYLIMLGMLYFELISRRTRIVFTAMLTLTIPFEIPSGAFSLLWPHAGLQFRGRCARLCLSPSNRSGLSFVCHRTGVDHPEYKVSVCTFPAFVCIDADLLHGLPRYAAFSGPLAVE